MAGFCVDTKLKKNGLTNRSAKDLHPDQGIPPRMLFDVSDLSRWAGPVVGIIRVEAELARWAVKNVDNVVLVFFDPESGAYREVNRKWTGPLLEGSASVNPWILPNTRGRPR